ncbi:hypothetical protein [Streptomyces sp. SHP 1-2]|uniref:hypothetical protein n=1 Tax=Streptomyces sp. SHP 1-2 TaxID=2769489 RepID=UPI002239043B|nr:hypothetical protein [Streptomyces sp. SHP 1-2]MCW5254454.1 hypothetical protein [Streptomyces sp. SHP 1-2]
MAGEVGQGAGEAFRAVGGAAEEQAGAVDEGGKVPGAAAGGGGAQRGAEVRGVALAGRQVCAQLAAEVLPGRGACPSGARIPARAARTGSGPGPAAG